MEFSRFFRLPSGRVPFIAALVPALALLFAVGNVSLSSANGKIYETSDQVTDTVSLGTVRSNGSTDGLQLSILASETAILTVEERSPTELPHAEWSKYAVRLQPPIAEEDIRADFGPFGTISLRFMPSGKSKRGQLPGGCRGKRPRIHPGLYLGQVELHGENDYFHLSLSSARGRRVRDFPLRCKGAEPPLRTDLATYVAPDLFRRGTFQGSLEVLSETPNRAVGLDAVSYSHDAVSDVQEGLLEIQPDMAIGRYSYHAGPAFFRAFAGEGGMPVGELGFTNTFNADPSAPETWSQDLSASFPGEPDVSLLGAGSKTRLCLQRQPKRQSCVGGDIPLLRAGPFDPGQR
jgi:hypothetical protein